MSPHEACPGGKREDGVVEECESVVGSGLWAVGGTGDLGEGRCASRSSRVTAAVGGTWAQQPDGPPGKLLGLPQVKAPWSFFSVAMTTRREKDLFWFTVLEGLLGESADRMTGPGCQGLTASIGSMK